MRIGHWNCDCCETRVTNRRAFLAAGVATAAAGSLTALPKPSLAQTKVPASGVIDVHHHLTPPRYLKEMRDKLQPPTLAWSLDKSLDAMNEAGVSKVVLSITTPGFWFGDKDQTRRLCREGNEDTAAVVRDHSSRFDMFGALPLPDVGASLREIEFVLDTLKAPGVALFTSYGDKWLGDPAFDPVMEELNRRKAIVYTHPNVAACCGNLVPGIIDAFIEYNTDTTRAIARMLMTGSATRYPDIRIIFSHAGGTMPYLIERFQHVPLAEDRKRMGAPVEDLLRRFYYDTAQSSNPITMGALAQLIPTSQILFGTDYPFRSVKEHVDNLTQTFKGEDLRAVYSGNALKMMPSLRT
jgi:predicted TIM-barrel fold metal-dependent hydrolase